MSMENQHPESPSNETPPNNPEGSGLQKKPEKKPRRASPNSNSSRSDRTRELLIEAGLQLFAKLGLEGTTVKEIADRAGVNVSLVSYYFDGKDGLYRACLTRFASSTFERTKELLVPPQTKQDVAEGLKNIVHLHFELFLAQPDLLKLVFRERYQLKDYFRDIFERDYIPIFTAICQFLQQAKANRLIREEFDPVHLGVLFHGLLIHLVESDDLLRRDLGIQIRQSPTTEKFIDQILKIYIAGILSEE